VSERRASLETSNVGADPLICRGRPLPGDRLSDNTSWFHRGISGGMSAHGNRPEHGRPHTVAARDRQPAAREGEAGPSGESERPIVAWKPGNSGGAKGPWFKASAGSGEGRRDWR
jgi:hypothetical protein